MHPGCPGKAVGPVQQVAGAAFETRRQALSLPLMVNTTCCASPAPADATIQRLLRQDDRARRRTHQHADDHGDIVVDEGVGVVDREVVRHEPVLKKIKNPTPTPAYSRA